MSLAKLLVATAIAAAPISAVSAQSGTPADSGSGHHARGWIAGAGAVAGAGLFMAFTQSGHNNPSNSSGFNFHTPTTPPPKDPGPTGGATPPTHTDTSSTSSLTDPGTVNTPGPQNNPPVVNDGNPPANDGPIGPTGDTPHTDDDPGFVPPDASTVPEPGSAALLATGIIGLAPLLRKRRK